MTGVDGIGGEDAILPFQLDRPGIRGRFARLGGTIAHILAQHDYPDPVADLVAEACLITALVGQGAKERWRLSLQIRGQGPVRLIATDWFAPENAGEPARLRAYAGFDRDLPAGGVPFALLGRGVFGMLVDRGGGGMPYQGLTPIAGGSLAACAETWFAQSDQIATRFALAAARSTEPGRASAWRAGGIMLQQMPAASVSTSEPTGEGGLMAPRDVLGAAEGEDWARVNLLLDTAETHELVGPLVSPERLLVRLFHQEGPRAFPAQTARFGCTCSAEKVVAAMAQYSARDLRSMTNEAGRLTADCQFCGARYEFDPATLGFEARPAGGT